VRQAEEDPSIEEDEELQINRYSWLWCLTAIVELLSFRLDRSLRSHQISQETKARFNEVEIETWEEIWSTIFADRSWEGEMQKAYGSLKTTEEQKENYHEAKAQLVGFRPAVFAKIRGDVRRDMLRTYSL